MVYESVCGHAVRQYQVTDLTQQSETTRDPCIIQHRHVLKRCSMTSPKGTTHLGNVLCCLSIPQIRLNHPNFAFLWVNIKKKTYTLITINYSWNEDKSFDLFVKLAKILYWSQCTHTLVFPAFSDAQGSNGLQSTAAESQAFCVLYLDRCLQL